MQIIARLQTFFKSPKSIPTIFVFLFLFFLPTQLGKHFFFDFSYLSGVLVDYLVPVFYLTDLLAIVLFWFFREAIIKHLRKNLNLNLIFLALFLVNIALSPQPTIGFYQLAKIIELYFVFILFKKIKISRQVFFAPLLAGTLFELALSICQLYQKSSLQGIFYWFGERYLTLSMSDVAKASFDGVQFLRPYGTFSHPNSMGGFYLLVYTFALFMNTNRHSGKRSASRISRIVDSGQARLAAKRARMTNWSSLSSTLNPRLLIIFISSILIFLSFSKITVLAYFLITIFYVLRKKIDCAVCSIAKIAAPLAIMLLVFRAHSDPLSLSKRVLLIQDSLHIIKNDLLFGTGLGQYLIAQAKIPNSYSYFFLQPVHNIFLLFLAQTGIILGGVIFYFLGQWFWQNRRNKMFLMCLFAVGFTGLLDHYWLTLQQNLLIVGVMFGFLTNKEKLEKG